MRGEQSVKFIRHEPCPKCGSKDNLARYDDGHVYCFGCQYHSNDEKGVDMTEPRTNGSFLSGIVEHLGKRKVSHNTCQHFDYAVGSDNGKKIHIAPYFDTKGTLVAQKIRYPNKDFRIIGSMNNAQLFGANLYNAGGKKIVVCEGEIDALSVAESQGVKWPVVSIPNGAPSARKALEKHLEYLESFDSVVLMFDQDEQGQKAVEQCVSLFSPSKVRVAKLPLKDANEMLVAGRSKELTAAIWKAKEYRPDGIVDGCDLWDVVVQEDNISSIDYPWSGLNEITRGCREGELVTITSGSGIGKTSVIREMAYSMINSGERVGMIMLEETVKRTGLGLMGLALNKPIHLDREGVDENDMRMAFDTTIGSGKVFLYDHFGSTRIENLLSRVRFLAKACFCRYIFLDHLSIVVSGIGDGDERRMIDNAMTMLRTLVQETGVGLILVSHLRRSEGDKGFENGRDPTLNSLRGSHSIAQLSDMCIALSRDQSENSSITKVSVLKNRFSGETGLATYLSYDRMTGRLSEELHYTETDDAVGGISQDGL